MATAAETNQKLAELFSGHGIPCTVTGDQVAFQNHPTRMWTDSIWDGQMVTKLVVNASLEDGRVLSQIAFGAGVREEIAIKNAFATFETPDLHVLARTLFGSCPHADLVSERVWTINGVPRKVIGGAIQPEMPEELQPNFDWFQDLVAAVLKSPLDNRLHWIRLWYCQKHGEPTTCSLKLDNEHWVEFEQQMPNWKFKRENGIYRMRMFMTVLPA